MDRGSCGCGLEASIIAGRINRVGACTSFHVGAAFHNHASDSLESDQVELTDSEIVWDIIAPSMHHATYLLLHLLGI